MSEGSSVSGGAVLFSAFMFHGALRLCQRCRGCNPPVKASCKSCEEEAKTEEEADLKFGEEFSKAFRVDDHQRKFKLTCVACHHRQEEEQRRRSVAEAEEAARKQRLIHGDAVPYH